MTNANKGKKEAYLLCIFAQFIGSPTPYKLCQLILLHIHEQDVNINTPYVLFQKKMEMSNMKKYKSLLQKVLSMLEGQLSQA
jgi:hypothetical protein